MLRNTAVSERHTAPHDLNKTPALKRVQNLPQMLTSFRGLPWRAAQPYLRDSSCRSIVSSAIRNAEVEDIKPAETSRAEELQEDYEGGKEKNSGRLSGSARMLELWLRGEGSQYRTPRKPNNWLGGDVVRYSLRLNYFNALTQNFQ